MFKSPSVSSPFVYCTKTINYKPTSVSSNHYQVNHSKSKYELLDNLGIKKFNVQHNTFDIMYLKNVMKEILCAFEDNSFQMNVESWGNRGNKV